MNAKRPLSGTEWFAQLAHTAWQRGQAALERGDTDDGRRWLERAHRLAPADLTVMLSLAAARLAAGAAAEAIALFARVADEAGAAEPLVGLAGARHLSGDDEGAAAALRRLLSGHAITPEFLQPSLLEAVTAATGLPGWCWCDAEVVLRAATREPGDLRVVRSGRTARLDGTVRLARGDGLVQVTTAAGTALLGSPIDSDRLHRVEGAVRAVAGGIEGWAWRPAAPAAVVPLRVRAGRSGREAPVIAADLLDAPAEALARPRRFRLHREDLPGDGTLHVLAPDGTDLMGSPLDPGIELRSAVRFARREGTQSAAAAAFVPSRADLAGPPARAKLAPHRSVAVVVPVYRGRETTRACLDAVQATVPAGTAVIVVDDASPDQALRAELASREGIALLRHERNRGFPAAANTGLSAALALRGGRDVVLLNSDTLPAPGWLEGLREAVHAAPDIGTATPLSNDGGIVSYPDRRGGNPVPDARSLRRIAVMAERANRAAVADIPTAVGFCMYIRRECLGATGLFREDLFAQGYGEENDFCIRARHLGWRHVAVPAAFVAHTGGASFGAARTHLLARNLEILERLHPGWHAMVAAFGAADPLHAARRALDCGRWRAGRRAGGAVVLIAHDSGGGVERVIRERCDALTAAGMRPVVIRPVVDPEAASDAGRRYLPGICVVGDGAEGGYPNLHFRLPEEMPDLVALLRADKVRSVEIHHALGHHDAMLGLAAQLGVPQDIVVHDYAFACPRVTFVGAAGRYCGEPADVSVCDACLADGPPTEDGIGATALRARSARLFARARRVSAPSRDAAARLRRYFADVPVDVAMHEDDAAIAWMPVPRPASGIVRVCVLGAIGVEKGYDVLLACARDAAARRLPLEFVVVGHTIDDARLFATEKVFVTGPYRDEDAVTLVRAQGASLGLLPSIWPETWCFALTHLWRAGLPVAAFDIGAVAERIRRSGRGRLFPLGMPAAAMNNALLARQAAASDECASRRRAELATG